MRIAAVRFLNAAPLYWGLRAGRHPADWDVRFEVPSRCADLLARGEADVGLVPAVTLNRIPGMELAAPLGVASFGETKSVLLLCGGPLDGIRKVYLDPASRSSQALAKVLLRSRLSHAPGFQEQEEFPEPLPPGEAALLIGDRALKRYHREGPDLVVDLPALWKADTSLPFVFAVWAARPGVDAEEAGPVLADSFDYGQERLAEIVADFSAGLALPEDSLWDYLTRRIYHRLGPPEMAGLRLFLQKARELDES